MNLEKLFVLLQHIVPQHAISRLAGAVANCRWDWLKTLFIHQFARIYQVNMAEAAEPDLDAYEHFNAFFTRALREDARPVVSGRNEIACPADGAISQIGTITDDRIFQAKGHNFGLVELLGGDAQRAEPFRNGSFATIYLSPRDYHRVHMPYKGTLTEMVYVPGKLFSVNDTTARLVPELFSRNERVVAIFDTSAGPMAMVLVGAMIVASVETVWAGLVAPAGRRLRSERYGKSAPTVTLDRGEEMGRFLLGSTVIVVFPKDMVDWNPELAAGDTTVLGTLLGKTRPASRKKKD